MNINNSDKFYAREKCMFHGVNQKLGLTTNPFDVLSTPALGLSTNDDGYVYYESRVKRTKSGVRSLEEQIKEQDKLIESLKASGAKQYRIIKETIKKYELEIRKELLEKKSTKARKKEKDDYDASKLLGSLSEIGGLYNGVKSDIMGAPQAAADELAIGVGSAIGATIGATGANAGALLGLNNLAQGCAAMAADLTSQAIADIVSFSMEKLVEKVVGIITPPTIGEVMGIAAKRIVEVVKKEGSEELLNLTLDAETLAEIKEQISITKQLTQYVESITDRINKVVKKINDWMDKINKRLNDLKLFMAQGEQWMQDQTEKYTDIIKEEIEWFLDEQSIYLLAVRRAAINALGNTIGSGLGQFIVSKTFKSLKAQIDKVRETTNNKVLKAKSFIHDALLTLLGLVGSNYQAPS